MREREKTMQNGMPKTIEELDTPALLVDLDRMEANLRTMQAKADAWGVKLRPHTKTHRTPELAKLQIRMGAAGITVAKLGEAEVMAAEGIEDIFIANEIVGPLKLERLKSLHSRACRLAVGVDHPDHIRMLREYFEESSKPLEIMIDVETGDPRTGVAPGEPALALAREIIASPGLALRGIYTHDGQSYDAPDLQKVREIFEESQRAMLETASLFRSAGIEVQEISVGSTPSLLVGTVLPGITEIRPGTHIFMDADQAQVLGTYEHCAQSVLVTVISRPTPERVVVDGGTKAFTYYSQSEGITAAQGRGRLKEHPEIFLNRMSDEHASFDLSRESSLSFSIGDRMEIIPNHACPTTNLYEYIYGVRQGRVEARWPVLCRGKSQ